MNNYQHSDFPTTSHSMLEDLASGSNLRLDEFLRKYESPMISYLQSMGVDFAECEESVSDFIFKIMKNRTVFIVDNPTIRFHRRLRTSLLNHFLDRYRKRQAEERRLKKYQDQLGDGHQVQSSQNPLEFAWALSLLELAVEAYRNQKLGTGSSDQRSLEQREKDRTDWEIFLRRYIGCPQDDLQPRKLKLDELASLLNLPPQSMKDRCVRIRKEFNACLQQVLRETIADGSYDERWTDVQFSLLLGNSQCIDLSSILPEFLKNPPMESDAEFSMASLSQMEPSFLEELVLEPGSELAEKDLGHLWRRMLEARVYCGESVSGTVDMELGVSLEDLLYGNRFNRADAERIKNLAKNRGTGSHSLLQKLHHGLYVLTIAVAKNRWNVTISSFGASGIVDTFQRAMRYDDWLDDRSKREIEAALRKFLQEARAEELDGGESSYS